MELRVHYSNILSLGNVYSTCHLGVMRTYTLLLALCLAAACALAQTPPGENPLIPDHRGLKLYVGQDSQAVFRPILVNQFWAKFTHNNPGTAQVNAAQPDERSTTFGMRRVRVLLLAELGDRLQAFTQIGINNQTFASGGGSGTGGLGGYGQAKKPQVFVHDAWTQYRMAYRAQDAEGFPSSLYVGAGLHYYHGISRLSQGGIPSQLLLDFPIFNFPDIEQGNQFARQFGVYAKGDVRRFHYRLAVNQPFLSNAGVPELPDERARDYPTRNLSLSGHVEYHFGEWEGHTLPFRPMTYIGGKRLLNVGIGFYRQPDATATYRATPGSTPTVAETFAKSVISADVYAEQPIGESGSALTGYLVYYRYDFGPNYYRSFGLLNTAPGNSSAQLAPEVVIDGFGNAEPLAGTGGITHVQLGYLFPTNTMRRGVRVQAFGALSHKDLDFLGVPVIKYDLGANLFLRGHSAKLSAQVGLRPQVYATPAGGYEQRGHRGELVVQMQVAL